jgi:hypothetical protein
MESSRLTSPTGQRPPLILQLHSQVKRRIAVYEFSLGLSHFPLNAPTRVKVDRRRHGTRGKEMPSIARQAEIRCPSISNTALRRRHCSEFHLLPKESLQSDTSPQSLVGESLVSRRSHNFQTTRAVPIVRPTQDHWSGEYATCIPGVYLQWSRENASYTSANALDFRLRLRLRSHYYCQFSAKVRGESIGPSGLPLHLRPISKRQFVLGHRTEISCT